MADTTPTPTPHRATPQQWERIKDFSSRHYFDVLSTAFNSAIRAFANALLQHNDSVKSLSSHLAGLAARVEALEAQQTAPCPHIVSSDEGTSYCALAEQAQPSQPAAPVEGAQDVLVVKVAEAISKNYGPADLCLADLYLPEARDAIRAVARWLRDELHGLAADRLELELYRLEQEAGR